MNEFPSSGIPESMDLIQLVIFGMYMEKKYFSQRQSKRYVR